MTLDTVCIRVGSLFLFSYHPISLDQITVFVGISGFTLKLKMSMLEIWNNRTFKLPESKSPHFYIKYEKVR